MWKSATAAAALLVSAWMTTAPARGQASRPAPPQRAQRATPADPRPAPPATATATEATGRDPRVFQAEGALPEPEPIEKIQGPSISLPNEPIEPYLLTRAAGPFMVLAHTFRGPDATRFALALAKELREKEHLPAYIFHLKVQPGRSNIRDVPPTAGRHIAGGEMAQANFRVYDEAAVLVGDCPTIDDSEKVLHRVKKLRPACLDGMPHYWQLHKSKGLSRAILTTNPYRSSSELYPGKKEFDPYAATVKFEAARKKADPLIKQINTGPRNIYTCPGRYTLSVAEFNGRSMTVAQDTHFLPEDKPQGQSPLVTAAEDAQRLAENLAKNDDLRRAGYEPYVYHDRYSSRVTLGAFRAPDDPSAQALRELILKQVQVKTGKKVPVPDGKGGTKYVEDITFLSPSNTLMEIPPR